MAFRIVCDVESCDTSAPWEASPPAGWHCVETFETANPLLAGGISSLLGGLALPPKRFMCPIHEFPRFRGAAPVPQGPDWVADALREAEERLNEIDSLTKTLGR